MASRAIVAASVQTGSRSGETHGQDDEDVDARADRSVHAVLSGRGRHPEENAPSREALVPRRVGRRSHHEQEAGDEAKGGRSNSRKDRNPKAQVEQREGAGEPASGDQAALTAAAAFSRP